MSRLSIQQVHAIEEAQTRSLYQLFASFNDIHVKSSHDNTFDVYDNEGITIGYIVGTCDAYGVVRVSYKPAARYINYSETRKWKFNVLDTSPDAVAERSASFVAWVTGLRSDHGMGT